MRDAKIAALNHRYVYLLLSLISLGCVAALWISDPLQARALSQEDGLIQTLSAAFWAVGMGCCLVAIRRKQFTRFAYLWLALCFVFLGEETSWFQRYLGYHVPFVERASTQSEFNLHNLALLPDFLPQLLFTLGMLLYFLFAPIALQSRSVRSLAAAIRFPDPTMALGLSLWIPIAISFIRVASDPEIHHAEAETREMLFAFFALLYTFSLAVRHTGLFSTWPPIVPERAAVN